MTSGDIKKLFQSRHGIYGENGFDIEFSVCISFATVFRGAYGYNINAHISI